MEAYRYWRRFQNKWINNHYYLEKLLGVGGYGSAFVAKEIVRDKIIRKLAIKLILPEEDEKKLEKQLEELDNAVNLSHPHLLHCYAPGECTIDEEEFLYLVMELAEESLDKRLKQGIISATETREIIKGLASALVYLHEERKQVHRDLKPANVLKVGENWKLSDFGLVCSLGMKTAIHSSNLKGTIRYVPPEAYDRGLISPAWDIWSLGVMITEMLTGKLPFAGNIEQEIMKAILDYQISIDWDKLPTSFSEIVRGCLVKEYKLRWNAQQILDELQLKSEEQAGQIEYPVQEESPEFIDELQLKSEEKNGQIEYAVQEESPQFLNKFLKPEYTFQFQVFTVNDRGKNINIQHHQAKFFQENLINNIFLDMVSIPGGIFIMGSSGGKGYDKEKPQHKVIVKPFFMGKFPITQEQWQAVASLPKIKIDLNRDPSYFKGENRPVEQISWYEAVEFCARLSRKIGKNYRLPSEAEWEYACRAGTTTPFYFGKTITTDLVNFNGNYIYASTLKGEFRQETTDVGIFPPNFFGLYDMHGNVWEWCADNWHDNYKDKPYKNSGKHKSGFFSYLFLGVGKKENAYFDGGVWQGGDDTRRVFRGGSWGDYPWNCRAAFRGWNVPEWRCKYCGFRVAFSPYKKF